jgi:hypothetical protein
MARGGKRKGAGRKLGAKDKKPRRFAGDHCSRTEAAGAARGGASRSPMTP